METFTRFLYEFLSQFFSGIITMLKGLGSGIGQIFDIKSYQNILDGYKNDLSMPEWVLVVIAILLMLILVALVIALIYLLIRKYLKFRKQAIKEEKERKKASKVEKNKKKKENKEEGGNK